MEVSREFKLLSVVQIKNVPILVGVILGVVVLNFMFTGLYNLYFHPLCKFPGPKLAAATGLVFSYKLISGEEVSWEHEMHQKYGEVVRLGPDRLTYITAQAWKDIAGPGTGQRLENPKDRKAFGPNIHGDYVLAHEPSEAVHRSRRRVFAPAFSDRALNLQEPLILGYLHSLVRNIKNQATGNPDAGMDIVKLLNCMTFDVMADLAFGEPLGLLEQSEYTPWVQAVFGDVMIMSITRLAREYRVFSLLIKAFTPKSVVESAHMHYNHSYDRVVKRLARSIDIGKPDIWKLIMEKNEKSENNNEGPYLSKKLMTADAVGFMMAGTETTASLLSGLLYLLLKHPHEMQRLQAEIRTLDKAGLRLRGLYHLPFMAACISEALRLYPPGPIAFFRTTPKGGNEICGEWIPENTRVGVPHYAAYHNPINFKDPDSFLPERWLSGTGYESDRKDIFNPFSVGPRNCLGQNLANHEMRVILAGLIWHFDFQLCPESEGWINQKVHWLWVKPKLLVKAKYIR